MGVFNTNVYKERQDIWGFPQKVVMHWWFSSIWQSKGKINQFPCDLWQNDKAYLKKYLEGIVARLGAANLVDSIRGKYGGYRLSKSPKEYTIIEILLATEESMAIISTLDEGVSTDTVINERTVGFWAGLQKLYSWLFRKT